jgi:hypothetical protein
LDYLNSVGIHYLCGFSETRMISSIQIDEKNIFEDHLNIRSTINQWAETRDCFETPEDKEEFKKFANEVEEAYKEKCK